MSTIEVPNLPYELHNRLKISASQHRRSVNSEVISCLEKILLPNKLCSDKYIDNARKIRRRLQHFSVTQEELQYAKSWR